jgi:hypothetical protein
MYLLIKWLSHFISYPWSIGIFLHLWSAFQKLWSPDHFTLKKPTFQIRSMFQSRTSRDVKVPRKQGYFDSIGSHQVESLSVTSLPKAAKCEERSRLFLRDQRFRGEKPKESIGSNESDHVKEVTLNLMKALSLIWKCCLCNENSPEKDRLQT